MYMVDLGLLDRVDHVNRGLGLPIRTAYTSIIYAVA